MVSVSLKFTTQEQNVIGYLSGKTDVAWEELAQFSKDPKTVKLKTMRKVVSEVKRKFTEANLPVPFNCEFKSLTEAPKAKEPEPVKTEQTLVKVKTTPSGNVIPADSTELMAHVDFKLDKAYRRVKTRSGNIELGEQEWEIFSYLHKNAETSVTLEDFKNVLYKNWGSKTPHTWADSIARSLTKLRKNIPELKLKGRLLTITSAQGTSYMLK